MKLFDEIKTGIKAKKEIPAKDTRREYYERSCSRLTEQLENIRNNYDMTDDPDTIDALIYEENAVLCRLDSLYRQARSEGITLEPHERRRYY